MRARLYATAHGVYETAAQRCSGSATSSWRPAGPSTTTACSTRPTTSPRCCARAATSSAAIVADGWWSGFVGFDARRAGAALRGPARLPGPARGRLRRRVAAGDRHRCGAGPSSPARSGSADLLMGELVDAPAAAGRGSPVAVLDTDLGPLVAEPDQPIRVTAELPADRRSTEREPGRFIVDFGQNLVGRVRLRVRGATAGRRIVLRHAEVLDRRRALPRQPAPGRGHRQLRHRRRRRSRCSSRGSPSTASATLEVTGYPRRTDRGRRHALVCCTTTRRGPGRFECSDPMVNQLQANIVLGPARQLPRRAHRLPAARRAARLARRRAGLRPDRHAATPTSRPSSPGGCATSSTARTPTAPSGDVAPRRRDADREGAPAWGDAGVIVPWLLWRTYGDRRVAGALLRRDGRLGRAHPPAQPRPAAGGTAPATPTATGCRSTPTTPRDVLATAYFARSAQIVAEAAEVLGRARRRGRAPGAARRDPGRVHRVVCATTTAPSKAARRPRTCWRWRSACCRTSSSPAAVDHLAADVEKRGNRLTTGFVGVALLCPVLADHGRADLAYALLQQEEFPSWGYSIRHGATTIWERWDGWTEHGGFQSAAMNSFNHYSLGSVGDWLFGRVAGIDQTPGFGGLLASFCCARCPAGRSPGPAPSRRPPAVSSPAAGRSTVTGHRDRHGAARSHRRAGSPHHRPGERPRSRTRTACSIRRRRHPAADLRPPHRHRCLPEGVTMKILPVLLAVTTGAALVACSGGTNAAATAAATTRPCRSPRSTRVRSRTSSRRSRPPTPG